MLVITRREGEEVVIGDPNNPIGVVRIASIKGDRVRVAFEFPREVSVHRREVAEQIVSDASEDSAPEVAVVSARPGDSVDARAAGNSNGRPRTTAGRHADAASRTH
ncbi:MAG: carbon storage regulator [Phycisphaera sp.]|nr:MAG: carbon storage regulator [Phycisphaera sp.]